MRKFGISCLVAMLIAGSFLVTAALSLSTSASASGVSYTWTGDGDGNSWGNAMNWNPNGVPGAGDSVTIGTATNPGPQVYVPPGTTVAGLTLGVEGFLYSGPLTQQSLSNITITSSFNWTGNTTTSGIYIAVDALGSVVVSGNGGKILNSEQGGKLTIEPSATLTLANSHIDMGDQAVIDVKGAFDAEPGAVVNASTCCVIASTVINEPTGVISVAPSGSSPGSLLLNAAELDDMGTIDVGKRCALSLTAPSTLANGVHLNGAGTTTVTSQLNLGSDLVLGKGHHLDVGVDAVVEGTSLISGSADFGWTGGEIDGAVTVGSKVVTTISGTAQKALAGGGGNGPGDLTLQGKNTLSGSGRLLMGRTSVLTNSGSLTVKKGANVQGGANNIMNSGTLTVVAGRGTAKIEGPQLENSGKIALKSGTLEVGLLDQSAGSTELMGGKLIASEPVVVGGGTFLGHGPLTGGLDNEAIVAPDSTGGALFESGPYVQSGVGTLSVTIDGSGAGHGYSQLAVTGSAGIAGTLDITTPSGFAPTLGESFSILTASAGLSGTFSSVVGTQLSGGDHYNVVYGANSVTLTVA
jgi:hypothetical protein